ncbi:LysR family transcriptional regulator [Virgibacillus alimentarius]|uniref:DNA-binding transcriptional LysR family regulator n=1 Tax=Virgibacillus alimentarius TaxID=698769 RepID=A0ABS4S995_9BACI|nr:MULTISPECIES: LysR family transcriptional regulator [Virgibacillus]MBP2258070.1 DNA-binding transcriptional LysR family regulator [Virgibacillus alimentarius]HLR67080.1 LysR family transcriptional regulator [Virgibacillus sp.]
MTITQFEIFVQVVESESFTKAAHYLNMTQSAVSHAIAGLEKELGCQLFIRNRRKGLYLTAIGERILIHAREILRRVSSISEEVDAITGIESGTIRLGSFPSASAHLLPKMLAFYQSHYPKVKLSLFEGTYHEVNEWLLSGIIDVGFSSLPHENLELTPLVEDKMVVVLPVGHPLEIKDVVSLEEATGESLILTKAGSEEIVKRMFDKEELKPNIAFEVQGASTILNMVKEGLGITIGPELALPMNEPGITIRDIQPMSWRTLGLSCPSVEEASPAVRAFIELAQKLFK